MLTESYSIKLCAKRYVILHKSKRLVLLFNNISEYTHHFKQNNCIFKDELKTYIPGAQLQNIHYAVEHFLKMS